MTREADVYAFAIACVEIINMGKLPWGSLLEDGTIRNMVLKESSRPPVTEDSRFYTVSLQEMLRLAWHRDPAHRPPFSKLARDFKILRKTFAQEDIDSPAGMLVPLPEEDAPLSPSPDMRPPVPLPPLDSTGNPIDILGWNGGAEMPSLPALNPEETVANDIIKMPEAVFFRSTTPRRNSLPTSGSDAYADDFERVDLDSFYPVSALVDANTAAVWNERRYRLLLTHKFHPSLVLPLWQPCPVQLGAVGYLQKPEGRFVTIMNALHPGTSEDPAWREFPSVRGYGEVEEGSETQDKRSLPQKGWDSIIGLLTRTKKGGKEGETPISRRYTSPLKAGHVFAELYTETTEYRYMKHLTAAKKWFQQHIFQIMKAYPHIQKEEFCLVIGLLRTPNYGLFVSHNHPDGHVHFNVHKSVKAGSTWGTFTTDNANVAEHGPSYDDVPDTRARIEASKVSPHGGPWDAVLLSRLRFRADENEPTWKL